MEPEITKLLQTIPEEWRAIILGDNTSWTHLYCTLRTLIPIITQISPIWENIFAFTRLVKFESIKCIILGQDPYPNLQDAMGYAFSSYCASVPTSANNIFKRMHELGILNVVPSHANLNSWAKQGVLSLNAALTCLIKKAGSHEQIWKVWTAGFIARLRAKFPEVPWILMGAKAKELYGAESAVPRSVYTYHPSAETYGVKYKFDATVFTRANEMITLNSSGVIDWNSINYTSRKISVWTDGSCVPNNSKPEARGGWACIFEMNNKAEYYLVGALPLDPVPTNYRAEGLALFYAMREAYIFIVTGKHTKERPELAPDAPPQTDALTILGDNEVQVNPLGLPNVQINIDSKVWMENLTKHFPHWANENKFVSKVAPDITQLVWNMYLKLSNVARISFVHVYSHTGVTLNEMVDKLAEQARTTLEPGTEAHAYF